MLHAGSNLDKGREIFTASASAAHTTDYRARVLDEWRGNEKAPARGTRAGLQLSTTVDRLCCAAAHYAAT
jgi:hypothetical protein